MRFDTRFNFIGGFHICCMFWRFSRENYSSRLYRRLNDVCRLFGSECLRVCLFIPQISAFQPDLSLTLPATCLSISPRTTFCLLIQGGLFYQALTSYPDILQGPRTTWFSTVPLNIYFHENGARVSRSAFPHRALGRLSVSSLYLIPTNLPFSQRPDCTPI